MFNIENEMNPEALGELFALIDQLTEVRMKAKEPVSVDHFKPFILPALSLLGLHVLALLGLRYTPW